MTDKVVDVSNISQTKERDLQVDSRKDDVAASFLADVSLRPDAAELFAEATPKETKALVAKVDAIIVTLLTVALMMGSVDKVAIGSAAVFGLLTDTKLVGQQYSWTNSMIYFGAITAIIPSLMLMQRLPANRYIAFNVTVWGVVSMCSAAVKNYSQLLAVRYLLGLFESVIFAGFGLIVSMWFTRQEQPFRTAIIFSTLSSVTNGILAVASYSYKGTAIAQWRLLYLLVGGITLLWSGLLWAFLPANPTKASWLTMRQRVVATRRMQENHTGMENKTFKMAQFVEALVDPKTWLVFLINIALNIPNGGLVGFNSLVVKSLGFSTQQTLLLGIPTGAVSWMSSLFWGYVAVKTRQRTFSGIASCILPLIGTVLLYKLQRNSVSLLYLYLCYMYWGPYIVIMGSMYANTGGYTKKLIVYAMSYIGYCIGNIVGPQTFRAKEAPTYISGVIAMVTCYSAAIVLMICYYFYLKYLNRKKRIQLDAFTEEHGEDNGLLADWHDDVRHRCPPRISSR